MRWILFCLLLLTLKPCLADETNEQVLSTEDGSCAIHYLSPKTRKLWTIDVNKSYCHDGWVQGFTTVTVKDSLNRTAHTLTGFFHQGYWLSNFPGPIDTFYRLSPKKEIQDFIFEVHTDKKDNAVFYSVATATSRQDQYLPFNLCPEHPMLLVVHEPVTDFDQSLFQANILKKAQDLLKEKCPTAKSFDLIGGSAQILMEEDGPFHATVDIVSGQTTLSFNSPIPLREKLRPTELRRESAEHLITIHPQPVQEPAPTKTSDPEPTPDYQPQEINPMQQIQSAVDLSLLAHVFQAPIQGKTILYIDTSSSLVATHPLPLILHSAQPLGSGWHMILGTFTAQDETTEVNILWAKPCLKEWCADEN